MLAVSLTDFSSANLTSLAIGCLAVVGGFLAGYVFGLFAAKAFDKLVVHRESPQGLHKIIRYTCALIVAIIVGLLVFRSGGGDGNGGGGNGGGTKPGENTTGTGSQPTAATPGTPATKPELAPGKIRIVDAVTVKIFGGADVDAGTDRYFQVENEAVDGASVKTDIAGVKERVRERVKSTKGQIVIVYELAASASDGIPVEVDKDGKPIPRQPTTGFNILNSERGNLGATLLSPKQFQTLVAQQP